MHRRLHKLRNIALAAICAILANTYTPFEARAQLRTPGLSGSGPIGLRAPDLGNGPRLPDLQQQGIGPSAPTTDDVRPSLPRPNAIGSTGQRAADTVTNTLDGSVNRTVPATVNRATGPTNLLGRSSTARPSQAGRSGAPPPGERRFVAREVVVGLLSNLAPEALDAIGGRHGLVRLQSETIALTGTAFHRWRISDGRSVREVIRALEADAGVQTAQPNYRFALQQNEGPRAARAHRAQYAVHKLNLPEAHRLATGDNVLVAVIDSAVDTSHPELAGAIAERFDALGSKDSAHDHGTAVAGAIVARARLTGTAPGARILAIRAFDGTGSGAEGTTMTLLRSIDWAIGRGARVVNLSFAGPNDPQVAAALAAGRRRGAIFVAAAGNAGPKSPPLYPAADPNVIAVSATDSEDKLFPQSNRGRHVAIAAPGSDIIVPVKGGRYQALSGTSFSAAHVSGVIALLLQLRPNLSADAAAKILRSTAKDLGPKGRDDQFGAGLADAHRAVLSIPADVAGATPNGPPTAQASPAR